MQISSPLPLGTHVLIMIALQERKQKVTSTFLAGRCRREPCYYSKDLVQVEESWIDLCSASGRGGAELAKQPMRSSLLDIYQAVEYLHSTGQLFGFMTIQNPAYPIGHNIIMF